MAVLGDVIETIHISQKLCVKTNWYVNDVPSRKKHIQYHHHNHRQ